MNNYQYVFDLIKEQCNESNGYESKECLDAVVAFLVTRNCLPAQFYLDSLKHIGMITYNDTKGIALTSKGIQTSRLFIP